MDTNDLALDYVAKLLGKEDALASIHEAAAREEASDFEGSVKAYGVVAEVAPFAKKSPH